MHRVVTGDQEEVGPILIREEDKEDAMRRIYRILRSGGAALIGGRYFGMPQSRKVPTESLQRAAAKTRIPSIRAFDDMGQWVEIRKEIEDRGSRD